MPAGREPSSAADSATRPSPVEVGARRWARGVWATGAVLLVELVAVAMLGHRGVASIWELQWGSLWLSPTALAVALVLGSLGVVLVALAERGDRTTPRAFVALGVAVFGAAVAWGVGGGRHLATLPTRGGFAAVVAVVCGSGAWLLSRHLARWIRERPRLVSLGAVVAIALAEVTNRFVLVRLYPAFHLGLAVAALVLAPAILVGVPVSGHRGGRFWRIALGITAVLSLGALVGARSAAAQLAYFDNFRLFVVDQAPLGGQVVRLAAWMAPPAPLTTVDETCLEPGGCGAAGGEGSLDLRGRDLLLVTIDAVRADHVGAYGYERPTTPHIDQLAATGVRFEYAYCATPHTSYSVTSLMTGKYMRPLLLQGAGADTDTWAGILRKYGYRTAGFYPPAVFFIDERLFTDFRDRFLDFEYRKFEFLEGQPRVTQVEKYLKGEDRGQRVFVWVHLFGPHEPYEAHVAHEFGSRDVDRYDSEIAAADATVGKLVRLFREQRPGSMVIVSSDHGEEFGDHGGRYHGTTVYEEQVRVPLVVNAPDLLDARVVEETVQTVDLLPTVLAGLKIPRPPRIRGRDLSDLLTGARDEGEGVALAETEEYVMLAEGALRLVCARKIGACELFDVQLDPGQQKNVAQEHSREFAELRHRVQQLSASHGLYEERGLRAEGKGWPPAILRGVSGDGDAAEDVAALLDDADRAIRRKAAAVLFDLRRESTASALRLALSRDEDETVRRWCALALTRMGQGAPLATEILESGDLQWRRLAALSLAESGDPSGEQLLVAWWQDGKARDYSRSRELLAAFSRVRTEEAVWPLVQSLDDVRLRPYIAASLAAIGEEVARGPLARALAEERYQSARVAIGEALVALGAEGELAAPLVRFLGVPDPLPGGVGFALEAGILEMVGGPDDKQLARLRRNAEIGAEITVAVPRGGNGTGVRVLVRARNEGPSLASVHVGARGDPLEFDAKGMLKKSRKVPKIDLKRSIGLPVPPGRGLVEVHGVLPPSLKARAGRGQRLVVYAERGIEVAGVAVVPLADELPPPEPEPWLPSDGDHGDSADADAD